MRWPDVRSSRPVQGSPVPRRPAASRLCRESTRACTGSLASNRARMSTCRVGSTSCHPVGSCSRKRSIPAHSKNRSGRGQVDSRGSSSRTSRGRTCRISGASSESTGACCGGSSDPGPAPPPPAPPPGAPPTSLLGGAAGRPSRLPPAPPGWRPPRLASVPNAPTAWQIFSGFRVLSWESSSPPLSSRISKCDSLGWKSYLTVAKEAVSSNCKCWVMSTILKDRNAFPNPKRRIQHPSCSDILKRSAACSTGNSWAPLQSCAAERRRRKMMVFMTSLLCSLGGPRTVTASATWDGESTGTHLDTCFKARFHMALCGSVRLA
mmetsp:Transcript_3153/g.7088  ORF Transcript_3153/g.7088 Transcript_3153/m.7088 type:complete len:321 (-) Transcript_3153:79-1041(-)